MPGGLSSQRQTASELARILDEQILKTIEGKRLLRQFSSSAAGTNRFIMDSAAATMHEFVSAMAGICRAGAFRPAGSELAFGRHRQGYGNMGQLKLTLGDMTIELSGIIDRIDIAETQENKPVIVFDYKSTRNKKFDWAQFWHGLDIQLAVYMLAVRQASLSEYRNVAGAFYMPISVSPGKPYKPRGFFDGRYTSVLDGETSSKAKSLL